MSANMSADLLGYVKAKTSQYIKCTCQYMCVFFWVVMPRSKELKLDSHWGHPIFEGFFCHRNCVPVPCDSLPVETLIVVGLLASSFPYDFGLAKRIGSLHTFSILSKTIIYIVYI